MALAGRLTQDEELELVAGGRDGVPRLGIPPLAFTDGPHGVGDGATGTTSCPSTVNLAATWDPALAGRLGAALGEEARGKGKTLLAAPSADLSRSPLWGRSAESPGEDPVLAAALVAEQARGIQQQGVIAQVKHFVGYAQETGRLGSPLLAAATDVDVDRRALEELYLMPFEAAVADGGAASAMCGYVRLDATPVCQRPATLNRLRASGLRGFVGPDSGLAVRDVGAAAAAGVDNFGPGAAGGSPWPWLGWDPSADERQALRRALADGRLTQARLDQAAGNILTAMDRAGVLAAGADQPAAQVSTPANRELATTLATGSTVLLRNADVGGTPVLPLGADDKRVAVIGTDAGEGTRAIQGGSAAVLGGPVVTPLDGIKRRAPASTTITAEPGTLGTGPLPVVPPDVLTPKSGVGHGLSAELFLAPTPTFSGEPLLRRVDRSVNFTGVPAPLSPIPGTSARSGRWTGTLTAPATGAYRFSLTVAGSATLRIAGREVAAGAAELSPLLPTLGAQPTFHGSIDLRADDPVPIEVEYATDAALTGPRLQLGWEPPGDGLMNRAVRAARDADVAVVFAADVAGEGQDRTSLEVPGDQDELIEAVAAANKRTVVVLHTSGPVLMPWRDDVAAILEAWYPGQQSGTAIARTLWGDADPGGRLPVTFPRDPWQSPTTALERFPGIENRVDWGEGVEVGYRWWDARGWSPMYPFGHGLSYTSFELLDLDVASASGGLQATVRVRNTGERTGVAVPQLYVGFPAAAGEPPRQLKAFDRVRLGPGESRVVRLAVPAADLRVFDPVLGRRTVPGRYEVLVGTSSRDLPLRAALDLP